MPDEVFILALLGIACGFTILYRILNFINFTVNKQPLPSLFGRGKVKDKELNEVKQRLAALESRLNENQEILLAIDEKMERREELMPPTKDANMLKRDIDNGDEKIG